MTRAGYISKVLHSGPGVALRDKIRQRLRSAAGRRRLDVYDLSIVVVFGKLRPTIIKLEGDELGKDAPPIYLIHVGDKWIERRLGKLLEQVEIEQATNALIGKL